MMHYASHWWTSCIPSFPAHLSYSLFLSLFVAFHCLSYFFHPLCTMTAKQFFMLHVVSPAVKRPIWQTIKIVREITNIMGGAPKRIFVEVAREPGEKGVRKVSRRNQLLDLYKACKKEAPELYDRLANKESDNALRSDKLFLYYSQMGRCMYSGDAIDLDELFTNRYDIDHIYPQSKVMDDSIDNRVLVKRDLNSKKTDTFPVSEEYRKAGKALWSTLLKKGDRKSVV